MLRVERIEILDNIWVTPAPMWGHLESEEVDVERLVVHWWSNLYWDEDDSSGHYKLLSNRRNKAIYYDNFGNRDTVDVNVDTLRWTTDKYSTVDSLGYFYNTLTPVKIMQDKGSGSWMKLYWSIENTLIDSQEIFLMDQEITMKRVLGILLFFGLTFGQTYTEGDIVDDFGADICYNGEGYWSWEEQASNKVTFIASFATW